MKFSDFGLLTDQNIHADIVAFLRLAGFDVRDVKEEGWFGRPDSELLESAFQGTGSSSRMTQIPELCRLFPANVRLGSSTSGRGMRTHQSRSVRCKRCSRLIPICPHPFSSSFAMRVGP